MSSLRRRDADEYAAAFNKLLKRKPFEQASLLLCDFERCSIEQIELVEQLLFKDGAVNEAKPWADYIEYACRVFPDRRLQLQRLINKALEFLDGQKLNEDTYILSIYLYSAHLKKEANEVSQYIEKFIFKRNIGIRCAALYLQWADAVINAAGKDEDAGRQKAIEVLQQGVQMKANPSTSLMQKISQIQEGAAAEERLRPIASSATLANAPGSLAAKYIDDKLRNFSAKSALKKKRAQQSSSSRQVSRAMHDAAVVNVDNEETSRSKQSFVAADHNPSKHVSFCAALPSETVERNGVIAQVPVQQFRMPIDSSASDSVSETASGDEFKKQTSLSKEIHRESKALSTESSLNNVLCEESRVIQLNGSHYSRLNVLGKGGSSCVFRIISHRDGQVFAYKRVEVKDCDESDAILESYANEIALLKKLNSSTLEGVSSNRIIELIDYEINREERYVAMILEAGDVDLSKVLNRKTSKNCSFQVKAPYGNTFAASSGDESSKKTADAKKLDQQLDPFFSRMVWKEMLQAVDHIHQHRIVHGDLKPANFVFVKGHLKLIDFGIAKSFSSDTTNIYRDSQIGTINYMAPEAIAPMSTEEKGDSNTDGRGKMRLGRSSDIWSLGCILYQIVYGRPPFAALSTIQKLTTIPNPSHVIRYPDEVDADAIDSIKACLIFDPQKRCKIAGEGGLLSRAFLQVGTRVASASLNTDPIVPPASEDVPAALKRMSINHTATHSTNTSVTAGSSTGMTSNTSVETNDNCFVAPRPVITMENLSNVVSAVVAVLSKRAAQLPPQLPMPAVSTRSRSRSKSSNSSAADVATKKFSKDVCQWLQGMDIDTLQDEIKPEIDKLLVDLPSHSSSACQDNMVSTSKATQKRHALPQTAINAHASTTHLNAAQREPLKSLPLNIQNQIRSKVGNKRGLQSVEESEERISKWQRKPSNEEHPQDMRSALERRIGEMRKFLDVDQDNVTATESMDITGFNEYF